MKSTPVRGVKEFLNPYAYKQSEAYGSSRLTACLLHNDAASCLTQQG